MHVGCQHTHQQSGRLTFQIRVPEYINSRNRVSEEFASPPRYLVSGDIRLLEIGCQKTYRHIDSACRVSEQTSTLGTPDIGCSQERWGAGVETQKNVRGEIEGWGRVPFNEPYAPSLSTIYDGA